ncbi:MAG: OprO/OprP family phosphate-selective porin, partial [Planctomycetota bacterium]
QARLEMSGDFQRDYEFKVQADFPTGGASPTTGTLQDGYLGWKRYPECSLRIGQFKQPFSQEETTSTRFIDFVERSVVNRLVPARDIGLMIHGRLFEKTLEYEGAFYNGQGRAVLDGNDEKDVALRLRVTPFAGTGIVFLKNLRIGVAGTFGDLDSSSINGLDLTTTELGINVLDATTGSLDGHRTRLGVEFSWLYGPFGVRGEWIRRSTEVDIGAAEDERIDAEGWYLAGTWLLTGEDKPLENRVVAAHPFDPGAGHWGAFELAVRIASVRVDEKVFDLGVASAATNSNEVQTLTGGVNWYLTRTLRISADGVVERYDDEVDFGNGRTEDGAWGALLRFQIDF